MIKEADGSDDSTSGLQHSVGSVARITDNHGRTGSFLTTADAGNLAVLHDNLVDLRVEHVGTAMDSAQSRESLREATDAVDGVQEGAVAISTLRLLVKLHLHDSFNCRLEHEVIVVIEGDSMTEEIKGRLLDAELLEQFTHRHLLEIILAPGASVVHVDTGNKFVELSDTALFEQAHQAGTNGLLLVGRDLDDGHLLRAEEATLSMLHDVGSVDAFPFEVLGDLGVQKHLNELAVSHDELGDEIDIPVSVVAVLRSRGRVRSELLPQVSQIERGGLSTIVAVPVQVQNLLALDSEKS